MHKPLNYKYFTKRFFPIAVLKFQYIFKIDWIAKQHQQKVKLCCCCCQQAILDFFSSIEIDLVMQLKSFMCAMDVWINFYGHSDLKSTTTIHIVSENEKEDGEEAVKQELGDFIFFSVG